MTAEAERQQQLLQALWRGDAGRLPATGLQAYRANAGAAAERALAAACPTVQQLVGEASFAAIARALWQRHPPQRGDLAQWGAALPAFLAADPALQDEPCLADVARVDLAVHQAEMAADATLDPATLNRLAEHEPEALWPRLAPGAAIVLSAYPVAHIWHAHRHDGADRFVAVRAAFEAGLGDNAFVWRTGWRADVALLDAAETPFMQALLQGLSLGAALDAAPDLDFNTWLQRALQLQWLADVAVSPPSTETP
ncbi:MAG: putative DNA-binding domain-containing protein [Rubrivivax sp.]|nr:putative DNA-binding domain-containing protein [Rubrivivax sp.]